MAKAGLLLNNISVFEIIPNTTLMFIKFKPFKLNSDCYKVLSLKIMTLIL